MNIKFDKYQDGLAPVIIQDAGSKSVLMLGFMNEAALDKTLKEKKVTFYSRSRKQLWTKGETSGNFLHVVSILSDCDDDTILIKVKADGPVCHTGAVSCFGKESVFSIDSLESTITARRDSGDKDSYVAALFSSGLNRIAQKVGEEAIEMVIASKDLDEERFLDEAADLFFHYLVLLQAKGKSFQGVIDVLESRVK